MKSEGIDSTAPVVLILGGFLTAPPMYSGMAGRLIVRGVAGVVVAPVWTQDWLIAMARGPAAIATRSGRSLLEAGRLSARVGGGAPVLVVGHSAGGFIARQLTAAEPFPGRRFGAAERIGAIVTLGTPHVLSGGEGIGRRLREVFADVADAHVPGAFHSPRIGYVTVASAARRADPTGTGDERIAYLLYRSVLGRRAAPGTEGDGLVPVAATRLPGAREVLLHGPIHGPSAVVPWYGTDDALDEWWPVALETWRATLRWRAAEEARRGGGVQAVAEGVAKGVAQAPAALAGTTRV